MKFFNILIASFLLILSCKGQTETVKIIDTIPNKSSFQLFGTQFNADNVLESSDISYKYAALKDADSLSVSFRGQVKEVCVKKGCWMKVSLADGKETMVRFKDYGFFMPKDIVGKEVVVNGVAFVNEMSVIDQRHYAEDGGASKEEVAKITSSKITNSFLASGVHLIE